MNINLLKSSSNNIIVESTLVSSWIYIISSELYVRMCVRVCAHKCVCLCVRADSMWSVWSLPPLCGCLASRKARWASAALQSPVYLMRRPHAKLMWTSRSWGVHLEHAQSSPCLQHTAANRAVLLDLVGLAVISSRANLVVEFNMIELRLRPLLRLLHLTRFTLEVQGIITKREGNYIYFFLIRANIAVMCLAQKADKRWGGYGLWVGYCIVGFFADLFGSLPLKIM